MPEPVTLEEAAEVIRRLRRELTQANGLLEYYRDFAPQSATLNAAPAHYFAHCMSDGKWAAGRVIGGRLEVLAEGFPHEEEAVAAAWKHYKGEGLPMP